MYAALPSKWHGIRTSVRRSRRVNRSSWLILDKITDALDADRATLYLLD